MRFNFLLNRETSVWNRGFTLMELLLVVAIIGIVGGLAIVSLGGIRRNAEETLIRSELTVIRDAALLFKQDMGQHPQFIAELFQSPDPDDLMGGWWWRDGGNYPLLDSDLTPLLPSLPDVSLYSYDPVTRRGWNGPYIQRELLSGSNNELRETRVNPDSALESLGAIDSTVGFEPPKSIAILRSDYGSFSQVSKTNEGGTITRTISHYQLVFNDSSGELVVRFVDNPHLGKFLNDSTETVTELDIVAEIRVGIKL